MGKWILMPFGIARPEDIPPDEKTWLK